MPQINSPPARPEESDIERTTLNNESLHRSAFRAMVQDFEPIWFTVTMNAGIIGIICQQFPYPSSWIHVISTIAFMIDLVLFTVFSTIFLLRFIMFGKQAFREIGDSPSDLALMATWPISWLTLVAFVSLVVSRSYWGGYAWTIVAYVMWWIGAAWIFFTALLVIVTITHRHSESDQTIAPMIFLPAVSVATLATVGGLLSSYSSLMTAGLAVPVIIFSFFCVGFAIFFSMFLYTFMLNKLFRKGWPEPHLIASLFILVGPMGQTATALQLLGSAASTYGRFGGYNHGTFLTAQSATVLDTICVLLAFLLSGLSTVWLILAFIGMIDRLVQGQMSWTPTWNSIVFPIGTLTTSCILFSIELDSRFFRVMTAIALVFIVLMFLVNLIFTVVKIFKGELLIVKENPRAKEALEQQKNQ